MDNFIVSARKYRPANFISVIGQSHITSTLKNAISRNQLAHAYLFCGPRGVGKTTCARIFAKAINCLNPTPDAEACNECESCRSFNEGRSFNIHELDAASNNSVDDIRNLTDQVRIPPQIGRYSVYIIDEVHMLSLQAFNAFLKTLEEPPPHAVFILATTEKHKIIPTILSRCQTYDFNRIRVEDSVSYLKYIAGQEGVKYDEESLHIIAQKADGGMRDALSMFDKVVSFSGSDLVVGKVAETLNILDYDTYFTVTKYITEGNYTDSLLLFDEVLRKGFSEQTFIAGLNNHFRDLLMCKNPQTIPLLEVTGSVAERYKTQAAGCGIPLLFEGINLLTSVDAAFRTATNQRLHVELGLMKLCGLGQKKNSVELIASLPPLNKAVTDSPGAPAISSPAYKAAPAAEQGEKAQKSEQKEESVSKPKPQQEPVPQPEPAEPSDTTVRNAKSPLSFTGRSISSILNGDDETEAEENPNSEDAESGLEMEIDDLTVERLEKGCVIFAKDMMATRPRMGVVFENVQIVENRIMMKVPNESLQDEILRNQSELKKRLLELSGLRIPIEFVITVEVDKKGIKPVKVEDRLEHLVKKNPLVTELRRQLDLDIE